VEVWLFRKRTSGWDVTANTSYSDDAEQPQQQLEVLQSASGADQDHYQAITVVDGKENLWPGESQVLQSASGADRDQTIADEDNDLEREAEGLQHETGANVGAASMEKDNNGEQDTEKKVKFWCSESGGVEGSTYVKNEGKKWLAFRMNRISNLQCPGGCGYPETKHPKENPDFC